MIKIDFLKYQNNYFQLQISTSWNTFIFANIYFEVNISVKGCVHEVSVKVKKFELFSAKLLSHIPAILARTPLPEAKHMYHFLFGTPKKVCQSYIISSLKYHSWKHTLSS